MEVAASGIAIVGAGIQVSKATKSCYHDYKHAKKQMQRAQHHNEQIHRNQLQLRQIHPAESERVAPALAVIDGLQSQFPETW